GFAKGVLTVVTHKLRSTVIEVDSGTFECLERWLNREESILLLQEARVWFPAPTSSNSQFPLTPVLEEPMILSPWEPTHMYTYQHTNKHTCP
ncbi:mCG145122, partial [Mus musculus]